jgi:acyl-CoA synthetase (AMP-forming)/AMP-acid ligase II
MTSAQVGRRAYWDAVEARAAATPEGLFVADDDGRRLCFGELLAGAERQAAGLLAAGVEPGSTVAWILPTWIETMVLTAALARLDVTQVPLLPIYGEREIGHALRTTRASVVITAETFRNVDLVGRVRPVAGPATVIVVDRAVVDGDPSRLPPVGAPVDPDAVRWVFHTSGTTSEPKGARHSDATVAAAAAALGAAVEVGDTDRTSLYFPFAHIGGVQIMTLSLQRGIATTVMDRFDGARAVELMERERVTLAGAGPVFFDAYLAVQRTSDRRRLPDVRAFLNGGAPKNASIHQRLVEAFGVGILSNYGLTECPNVTGVRPWMSSEQAIGTEGTPNPGMQIEVREPDRGPCPPGQPGELWVKGPQLCKGYVDASLDVAAFDADGFFRTGDLVAVDDDGCVAVVGRLKDVIVRKGENISAAEVEDFVHRHPKVRDVAVIAVPDPSVGERCCAVVVPMAATDELVVDELGAFLRDEGLMVQKIPEVVHTVDELPRNAAGKVLKHVLRERFAGDPRTPGS